MAALIPANGISKVQRNLGSLTQFIGLNEKIDVGERPKSGGRIDGRGKQGPLQDYRVDAYRVQYGQQVFYLLYGMDVSYQRNSRTPLKLGAKRGWQYNPAGIKPGIKQRRQAVSVRQIHNRIPRSD